jgi:hypothetical protein
MSPELYVGPLTTYYDGSWRATEEPFVRKEPRAEDVEMVRVAVYNFNDEPAPISTALQEEIEGWRTRINREFASILPAPLAWDEADKRSAAATPLPEALKLWIASLDNPGLKVESNWSALPVQGVPERMVTRFSHIVRPPDIWLPATFEFSIETIDPKGKPAVLGSTISLLRQLGELNDLSWRAPVDILEGWNLLLPGTNSSLENAAKYSFCEAYLAARHACDTHLPMKFDVE